MGQGGEGNEKNRQWRANKKAREGNFRVNARQTRRRKDVGEQRASRNTTRRDTIESEVQARWEGRTVNKQRLKRLDHEEPTERLQGHMRGRGATGANTR